MMKITIVGCGYVGLVAGAGFADFGNQVICLDVDELKISKLNVGKTPIHEPGLDDLIEKNRNAGRLKFISSWADAVGDFHPDVVILAVGTPSGRDGQADLTHLLSAAKTLATCMSRAALVVIKSTVPVGTNDRVQNIFKEVPQLNGVSMVVSCPEFLKEGAAVSDFVKPERVVFGVREEHEEARRRLVELYLPIVLDPSRLIFMSPRSAELTKYAANAMLATRISFMNELANFAEVIGADIDSVRRGIGSDSRIGSKFLYAGCSWGGSCFSKDLQSLTYQGQAARHPLTLSEAVLAINDKQKTVLYRKIKAHFGVLKGKTVGVWGLAFKPNTDDVRDAPAISLVDNLLHEGCKLRLYDSVASENFRQSLAWLGWKDQPTMVYYAQTALEAAAGVDALVLVTEWHEFRHPDWFWIKKAAEMAGRPLPVIFDGRNIWQPDELMMHGFTYYGIGRG